jgi:uncharacterized protein
VTSRPRLIRRRSKIAGSGVFAGHSIAKNARIVEYKGQLISEAEILRREKRYLPRRRIWIFNIDDCYGRDAAFGGNIARYINHACRPNCYVKITGRTIWILASRPIRKGEELTYDYNTEGTAGIPCTCRPRCKRIL